MRVFFLTAFALQSRTGMLRGIGGASCLQLVALAMEREGTRGTPESP